MPVERFTKEEFEAALPVHKGTGDPLWSYVGIEGDEHTYLVRIVTMTGDVDPLAAIKVKSSVKKGSGISAETGKDSIRAWLVLLGRDLGKPLGAKVTRWTTRLPGWETRMTDVLRTLYLWRLKAGNCETCGAPKSIFKVKKEGPNKGRVFAKCQVHNHFVWITDENDSDSKALRPAKSEIVVPQPPSVLPEPPDDAGKIDLTEMLDELTPPKPAPIVEGKEPNAEQIEAITAPIKGAVRVLAGPGTGKTFVIERRYAFLLANGVHPDDILAVTHTKTMATELLERIGQLSPQVKGSAAERQICTIHAACNRILINETGDSRKLAKQWQVKRTLQDIADEVWEHSEKRPGWKEIFNWVSSAKHANRATTDDLNWFVERLGEYHGPRLHEARKRFDLVMAGQNLKTYGDMLFEVEQLLERDRNTLARLQGKYKWLIIDEGQDTGAQAMRILTLLAEPQNNFFIVGDPDQLLFRFTGATPETNLLDGFSARYPDGLTVLLTVNYRSTQAIVEASRNLIAYNYSDKGGPYDQEFMKAMRAREDAPEGNPITFEMYACAEAEAAAVALEIKQMIDEGRAPGTIFVATRTKAQLGYLEGPLFRYEIPFINVTGSGFWTQRHVQDVIAYLRLAHDTTDDEAFQRIYNVASNYMTFPWQKSAQYGEYISHRFLGKAFLAASGNSYEGAFDASNKTRKFRPGVEDLTGFVMEIQATLDQGPSETIREIIDECYAKWMKAEEGIVNEDESQNGKLEDLETVIDIAKDYDDVGLFLEQVEQWVKATQAKANRQDWDNYVVLATVHRLKGLERDVMFGLGFCEAEQVGLLPHTFSKVAPPNQGVLPTGGLARLEDERCIAYVLVTRAREAVYLSGCSLYHKNKLETSDFVFELGLFNREPEQKRFTLIIGCDDWQDSAQVDSLDQSGEWLDYWRSQNWSKGNYHATNFSIIDNVTDETIMETL